MSLRTLSKVTLLSFVLFGLCFAPSVFASDGKSSASRVIVVDSAALFQGSKAMDEIRKVMRDRQTKAQEEVTALQKKVQTASQDEKKKDEAKKLIEKLESTIEFRRLQLHIAFEKAGTIIQEKILEIVTAVKKERQANVVLQKAENAVILVDDELDVTGDVLERLNKDLPSVKVQFPSKKEVEEYKKKQNASIAAAG